MFNNLNIANEEAIINRFRSLASLPVVKVRAFYYNIGGSITARKMIAQITQIFKTRDTK